MMVQARRLPCYLTVQREIKNSSLWCYHRHSEHAKVDKSVAPTVGIPDLGSNFIPFSKHRLPEP